MADYDKREGGAWAVKKDLYNSRVAKCKIVSETNPVENTQFKNEDGSPTTQDVCKVQFDGATEALKVALNRATINGLIDAFGRSSSLWQGHELKVEIDKESGNKYPMYLIADGYKRIEDENGYSIIVKDDMPKL
jgi:hypothetical protein